jgi:MoaA/NifB/PqqE/SkfB family radical SAM enzyme
MGRRLARYSRERRRAVLSGVVGAEDEPRATTVQRVIGIWELCEEHHPELRLSFPRLPSSDRDPLLHPPEGPPRIPASPLGQERPRERLAVWELHTLRELLAIRLATSATRKVIINLTYKCNNACCFCAVGNRMREHGDTGFHKETLRTYAEKGIDLVDLDGGEPTLYPDLLKIISYARELGYRQINVTTNGRLMAYEKVAKKVLRSGITSLLISCHGPDAEVHEGLVRVKGAFEQTRRGIENAVRMRPPGLDLGVNTTLTKENWRSLPDFFELLVRLGVPKLNVQFLTPFGRACEEIMPDPEEIAPLLNELLEEHGDRLLTYLINVPFCFFEGREAHVVGDVLKLQRNMIFTTRETVNLFDYLAGARVRTEKCADCVFSVACDGFYSFEETFD